MYLTINYLNDKNNPTLSSKNLFDLPHFYIQSIQFPIIARSTLNQFSLEYERKVNVMSKNSRIIGNN